MALRITQQRRTELFVRQITENRLALEKVKEQISSGVKVNYASDASGKAGTLLSFQSSLVRISAHQDRISFATGLLEHQDAVLEEANNLMARAKEIATQAANGVISNEGRAVLASEVFQIRNQVASLANTSFQGRYIYGAADDDDPPFDTSTYTNPASSVDAEAALRYVYDAEDGTSQIRSVQVSDTDSIQIVTAGSEVFSNALGALEKLGRSLAGYRTTLDGSDLPTGAGTAYTFPNDYPEQTSDILSSLTLLETARSTKIMAERTDIGSRLNHLTQINEILENLKITTETSRAAIQDADILEVSAQFSNLQTTLQALLASGVQINNISILNYL